MSQLRRTALVVLLFALFTGCGGPTNMLVGTWKGEGPGPGGEQAVSVITFRKDGSMLQTVKEGKRTIEIKGSYTASDGKMRQTVESVTMNGKPADITGKKNTDMGYVVAGDELTLGTSSVDRITLKRVGD